MNSSQLQRFHPLSSEPSYSGFRGMVRRGSWNKKHLIIKHTCKLFSDVLFSSAQSSATLVESLRGLIDNSEIGSLLGDLRHQPFSALAYLMDFVHMVYMPSSDMEYEVSVYYYLTNK